ncbi:hypothetical protein HY488_01915 [Candidatus Woesearchaeota archaeon]|nr:hypothetical protein [Candidatus Woesearchaeota archaeon]
MPAKKTKVTKMTSKTAMLNKVEGHLWGITDAILEHADNVARFGTGTLQHEGQDIKLLAQELQEFLEKSLAQRRKIVAGNFRYYNRYAAAKK